MGGGKAGANAFLRPVTVQQILNAEQIHNEADFTIDGQPAGQVTFIGVVRQITTNATNVIYQIDDGTGMVDVRVWLDTQTNGDKYRDVSEWSYVRVIGSVKSFQTRRYVATGHLRRVKDANEIFYHKLDAIHAHQLTKKATGGQTDANGSGAGDDRMNLDSKRYEGLENPIHRKIMQLVEALANDGQDSGVPITTIARRMPSKSESEIREHVENLIGEGFLFTAQDENHVLSTMA